MLLYKLSVILCEGLVFGLVAIGIYVAFQWLRFPDLTPDGSFALGGAVFTKAVIAGGQPMSAILLACAVGALAGCITAATNRFARVPTVVAGLLVASALYSATWLLLGKPNQFLHRSLTLSGDYPALDGTWRLIAYIVLLGAIVVLGLSCFSGTVWGLRLRAIGENPRLAPEVGSSETAYTFLGLAVANAVTAGAGSLFVQRSFSADVGMGIGITIAGLAAMLLGLLLSRRSRHIWFVLILLIVGGILYKLVTFLTLEFGLPAESFRLVAALMLLTTFVLIRSTDIGVLKGLKWT